MEFLEVPLYDDDLWKLLVRFLINAVIVTIVVFFSYFQHKKSRPYTFTFLMMNVMVFFICFSLKKLDLGLGLALGLFAIFAIIRYRTDAIQVKEMTYLFIVIGIAVINALSNKKTSYSELMAINLIIISSTFLLERVLVNKKMAKQTVNYDRLDLLRPDQRTALFDDLQNRIGIRPIDVKVGRIDLGKSSANLTLYVDDNGLDDNANDSEKLDD
jgi:hypothetical protein